MESILDKVLKTHCAAIEKHLENLLVDGIAVQRISLHQTLDGASQINVDSIPIAEFRIDFRVTD